MNLRKNLLSDMKGALKSRDSLRLNTIRGLISEIKNQEIDLRHELGDDEIISTIATQIKKRKEAAIPFDKGGGQTSARRKTKKWQSSKNTCLNKFQKKV